MKPSTPVIAGHEEILVAERQPEYQTLPVIKVNGSGGIYLVSRWELNEADIAEINKNKSVFLLQSTFGKPMQPVLLQIDEPVLVHVDPAFDGISESSTVDEVAKAVVEASKQEEETPDENEIAKSIVDEIIKETEEEDFGGSDGIILNEGGADGEKSEDS